MRMPMRRAETVAAVAAAHLGPEVQAEFPRLAGKHGPDAGPKGEQLRFDRMQAPDVEIVLTDSAVRQIFSGIGHESMPGSVRDKDAPFLIQYPDLGRRRVEGRVQKVPDLLSGQFRSFSVGDIAEEDAGPLTGWQKIGFHPVARMAAIDATRLDL
jgi:hypothetical protein